MTSLDVALFRIFHLSLWVEREEMGGFISWSTCPAYIMESNLWLLLLTWFNFNPGMDK